jgi:hypothetical protein
VGMQRALMLALGLLGGATACLDTNADNYDGDSATPCVAVPEFKCTEAGATNEYTNQSESHGAR